jgi:hypothetical protein
MIAVVAAASAVVAGPALGSGIVYTKDANVWVARPDGSGAVALTVDGTASIPYRSPSRDTRGNVIAERADEILRLSPTGTPVGTPFGVLDPGITQATRQPLGLALSPNGATIGLFVFGTCLSRATSCPKTFYTPVARYEPPPDYNSSSAFPSWLNDTEVVMANEPDAILYQRLPEFPAVPWFRGLSVFGDPGSGLMLYLDEVAVSPARDRVAVVRRVCGATPDTCQRSLEIMNVPGPIPATAPVPACRFEAHSFSSPTWSPDGGQLAYAREDGVAVADLSGIASGCGAVTSSLVIPGGSDPEWGPADPPAASALPLKGSRAGPALRKVGVAVSGRRAKVRLTLSRSAKITLALSALSPRRRVLDRATRRFGKGSWIVTLKDLPQGRYELTVREAGRTAKVVRRFVIR